MASPAGEQQESKVLIQTNALVRRSFSAGFLCYRERNEYQVDVFVVICASYSWNCAVCLIRICVGRSVSTPAFLPPCTISRPLKGKPCFMCLHTLELFTIQRMICSIFFKDM